MCVCFGDHTMCFVQSLAFFFNQQYFLEILCCILFFLAGMFFWENFWKWLFPSPFRFLSWPGVRSRSTPPIVSHYQPEMSLPRGGEERPRVSQRGVARATRSHHPWSSTLLQDFPACGCITMWGHILLWVIADPKVTKTYMAWKVWNAQFFFM